MRRRLRSRETKPRNRPTTEHSNFSRSPVHARRHELFHLLQRIVNQDDEFLHLAIGQAKSFDDGLVRADGITLPAGCGAGQMRNTVRHESNGGQARARVQRRMMMIGHRLDNDLRQPPRLQQAGADGGMISPNDFLFRFHAGNTATGDPIANQGLKVRRQRLAHHELADVDAGARW